MKDLPKVIQQCATRPVECHGGLQRLGAAYCHHTDPSNAGGLGEGENLLRQGGIKGRPCWRPSPAKQCNFYDWPEINIPEGRGV